jgi:hypothetical protein
MDGSPAFQVRLKIMPKNGVYVCKNLAQRGKFVLELAVFWYFLGFLSPNMGRWIY